MRQDIPRQKLVFIAILALGLLFINAWLSFRNIQKMYVATGWVAHTRQVIEAVDNILSLTTVEEINELRYINTNNHEYLDAYAAASSALFKAFTALDKLIVDNPQQISRKAILKNEIEHYLILMWNNIYLGRQNSIALSNVISKEDRNAMETIKQQAIGMIRAENELLRQRTQNFDRIYTISLFTSLLANFISFIMLGAFFYLLRLHLINREKNMAESRRLALIVDFSEDAIIGKDLDGNITSWNDGAQRIFGYTSKEAINKSIFILVPPDRIDEETKVFKQIYRGERVGHYETVRQRKDGSLIEVSMSVSPIKDSNNVTIGASKIIRDITMQRRLEAELRDSENRLRKLSEDLAKSNKDLEQFAFIAAHDLKEPLLMIQSFADFLSRRAAGKLEKKEQDYLDSIKGATAQGQALIKNLLEFGRLGKDEELQMADLFKIIDDVKMNLRMLIETSDASIECDECLPRIKCFPMEIRQLFQNLIENAIKYRSPDPPKIHISAVETKNNAWLLAIKDNGVGIPQEDAERIFKIFERGQTDSSGSGIGLAICKKVVENHGGKIWVESQINKGSIFYFTLPQTKVLK